MSYLVGNPEDRFSCVAAQIYSKTFFRILGAATLNALGGVPVYACFVNESYINSYYDVDTKQLDYGGLEQMGDRIEGENVTKFVRQKDTAIHEAAISLRVKINLKRAKEKRVYSEKYRLVFKTVLNERAYWVCVKH